MTTKSKKKTLKATMSRRDHRRWLMRKARGAVSSGMTPEEFIGDVTEDAEEELGVDPATILALIKVLWPLIKMLFG